MQERSIKKLSSAGIPAGAAPYDVPPGQILTGVPLGIMLSLVVGKLVGVLGFSLVAIKT